MKKPVKKKKGFMDNYKTYDTSKGFGSPDEWRYSFNKRISLDDAVAILDEKNPYTILGLSEDANKEALKVAFRKLANIWHPDKNQGNEKEANEKMKDILAAYTVLKNKIKK